jgi:hypothetical protein
MKWNLPTRVLAVFLLCGAGIMTAQAASSTIITFSVDMATNLASGTFNPPSPAGTGADVVYVRGTFNGWAYPGLPLTEVGSSTIWTNSYNDTSDANGDVVTYLYDDTQTGDEGTGDYDNRAAYLPSISGASLVLPVQFYGDVGPGVATTVTFRVDMSEEIELGHWSPTANTVVVAGSFNGWSPTAGSQYALTNDPSILVTNYSFPAYPGGLVESNVYTLTIPITVNAALPGLPCTNSLEEWKYVEDPEQNWENPGPTTADGNDNRFFIVNSNQTLPLVSFSDVPYTPLCQVTLNVDMSSPIMYDSGLIPASETVWGTFNNWANGITLTNNPASANPNIFSGVINIGENASYIYQFRYNSSIVGGFVYDFIQGQTLNNNYRRSIEVPVGVYNTNVPTVFFNDLALNDVLPTATPVLFSVNMNDAVATNGYVFNPSSDGVYINGMFANYNGYPQSWYPWAGGVEPVSAPAGYQMIEAGSSTIYTNTIVLPAGTPVALSYQYGMDPSSLNGGPLENEAPPGANHYRVVRATGFNPYMMPVDTFTNQPYEEPFFSTGNIMGIGNLADGNLTVGSPVAGTVPVSWLGRPGAHLQAGTNLNSLVWQDLLTTDGTNWTAGFGSTNGFVSVTNWPASGKAFFRLVKP